MHLTNNKGFTLIELLVVIVLLGIITSLAVLSYGTSGAERKMEEEAKRLVNDVPRAIIANQDIPVEIPGDATHESNEARKKQTRMSRFAGIFSSNN